MFDPDVIEPLRAETRKDFREFLARFIERIAQTLTNFAEKVRG